MAMAIERETTERDRHRHVTHSRTRVAVDVLICVQREFADFIASITDEQYTQKPVGPMKSSIGGHVRHCLDHVAAVLAAARTGQLNYDPRERGTDVENDRRAALQTIDHQESEMLALRARFFDRRLKMTVLLSPAAPELETTTTLSRELAFVLSHTVHHNSLIAAMGAILGLPVPERFGYAPATLAWRDQQRCAQ